MKAYGDRVIIKRSDSDGDGPIVGKIVSKGSSVPEDLKEGMEIVVGKYAGQEYKDFIILNHTEILAINE